MKRERAILYARASSKDLANQEFSMPTVLKLSRQFAQKCTFVRCTYARKRRAGLQSVKEFVDVEAGLNTGWEQLAKMMRFHEENHVFAIIYALRLDSLIVRADGLAPREKREPFLEWAKRTYPQWQSFRDYLLHEWGVVVMGEDDSEITWRHEWGFKMVVVGEDDSEITSRKRRTRRRRANLPQRRSLRNYDWVN